MPSLDTCRCPRCGHHDYIVFTSPTTWRVHYGQAFPDTYRFTPMTEVTCNYCTFMAPAAVFDPSTIKH